MAIVGADRRTADVAAAQPLVLALGEQALGEIDEHDRHQSPAPMPPHQLQALAPQRPAAAIGDEGGRDPDDEQVGDLLVGPAHDREDDRGQHRDHHRDAADQPDGAPVDDAERQDGVGERGQDRAQDHHPVALAGGGEQLGLQAPIGQGLVAQGVKRLPGRMAGIGVAGGDQQQAARDGAEHQQQGQVGQGRCHPRRPGRTDVGGAADHHQAEQDIGDQPRPILAVIDRPVDRPDQEQQERGGDVAEHQDQWQPGRPGRSHHRQSPRGREPGRGQGLDLGHGVTPGELITPGEYRSAPPRFDPCPAGS